MERLIDVLEVALRGLNGATADVSIIIMIDGG